MRRVVARAVVCAWDFKHGMALTYMSIYAYIERQRRKEGGLLLNLGRAYDGRQRAIRYYSYGPTVDAGRDEVLKRRMR